MRRLQRLRDPRTFGTSIEPPADLRAELEAALTGAAEPYDWYSITLVVNMTAASLEATCWLRERTRRLRDRRRIRRHAIETPRDASWALVRMRHAMATPEDGAWLSATATMFRGPELYLEFNYDEPPAWDVEPSAQSHVDDLQRYPRPWAQIPEWHPARQRFDERSWERFRARGAKG